MPEAAPQDTKESIEEAKFFAAIAYISLLCIVTLGLKKDNRFALYHGRQGLVLFVAEVIFFLLSIIPLLGAIAGALGGLLCFIASVWGIVCALRGKYGYIPLVSEMAKKVVM